MAPCGQPAGYPIAKHVASMRTCKQLLTMEWQLNCLGCLVQKASVTHYRAFIEVAKGLGAMQESLRHADSQLDALLADLPALSAACEHFAQSTAVFTAKRAESKQLLSASAHSFACTGRPAVTCRYPAEHSVHMSYLRGALTATKCSPLGLSPCCVMSCKSSKVHFLSSAILLCTHSKHSQAVPCHALRASADRRG